MVSFFHFPLPWWQPPLLNIRSLPFCHLITYMHIPHVLVCALPTGYLMVSPLASINTPL